VVQRRTSCNWQHNLHIINSAIYCAQIYVHPVDQSLRRTAIPYDCWEWRHSHLITSHVWSHEVEEPSRVTLFHIVVCLTTLLSLRSVQSLMINDCGNDLARSCSGLIWGQWRDWGNSHKYRNDKPNSIRRCEGKTSTVRGPPDCSVQLCACCRKLQREGQLLSVLPIRGHRRRASWRHHLASLYVTSRSHISSCSVSDMSDRGSCTGRDTHHRPICCLLSVHSLANVPSNIHLWFLST
jgi:hypothetical protein